MVAGGARGAGQVGRHRQPQLISERHLVFGRDGRQSGEGHHAQTLRPASAHRQARNVPGAAEEDDGRRLASDVMQAADLTAELTELPLF